MSDKKIGQTDIISSNKNKKDMPNKISNSTPLAGDTPLPQR
jgi:hypothetical protein